MANYLKLQVNAFTVTQKGKRQALKLTKE